jgi:hypothetical protein
VAAGRGGGGGLHAVSNHPALAASNATPPYPRRGLLSAHRILMSLGVVLNFRPLSRIKPLQFER